MTLDDRLAAATVDLAALTAPDRYSRPTRSVAAATLQRLADRITRGYPTGGSGGRGKGSHADPTASAAMATITDPAADGVLRAELEDCLQRIIRDTHRARQIIIKQAPIPEVDLAEVHACNNPKCENICTGQPTSDRLRRWHGQTDPICPRCYQHMDAQRHAGIPEDRCRLWPYDARPKTGRLTRSGAESFTDWATRSV